MQADITVVHPGVGPVDYRLEGPDQPRRADLERALERAGIDPGLLPQRLPQHGDFVSGDFISTRTHGPALHVVGGIDAGTRIALSPGISWIGRGPDATHQLRDPELSHRHFEVDVGARFVTLTELDVTNRASINGERLLPIHALRAGDRIRIGTTVLEWEAGGEGPIDSAPTLIELPAPPIDRPRSALSALAFVLPALVTAFVFGFGGSGRMLILALVTPIALVVPLLVNRYQGGGRRARRRYAADLERAQNNLRRAQAAEAAARRRAHPGPGAVDEATTGARHLLEPTTVRLGLGVVEARLTVVTKPGESSHPQLVDVPICVELDSGLALGAPAPVARAQARWLLLQLARAHLSSELSIILSLDASTEHWWHWTRWLPHLSDVRIDGRSLPSNTKPEVVGCQTVLVHDSSRAVPEVTGAIVITIGTAGPNPSAACTDDTGLRQTLSWPDGRAISFDADTIGVDGADKLARSLAFHLDADAPSDCHLLDLLGLPHLISPDDITRRWDRDVSQIRIPLGASSAGVEWVDLDRDGPHALIGGTTGSGKSQLLQTLVFGLAVMYSPAVVQFLLIDYKGGAAFGPCGGLPHTTEVLTDLDTAMTARALRSLSAELRRRERLLREAGVADIAAWQQRRTGEPLARLLVIVDEFATLATELPDFVTGLVGIAQRGRSLGMHVVLATQRPGGSVSADIRANSNLRIALRTISDAESIDLIDVADAAALDPAPGNAIRAGAPPRSFRVAHLGPTRAATSVRVRALSGWRQVATSTNAAQVDDAFDQDQLVSVIVDAAVLSNIGTAPAPWLAPLPAHLPLSDLPQPAAGVAIGLVDLPDEQRRQVLSIDLDAGSTTVIAGGPRSGRSTALVTAALAATQRRAPNELHVHALDFADGGLAALCALPHLGTMITGSQSRSVAAAFIARLAIELQRRQEGPPGPPILLLIDGWSALNASLDAHDLGVSSARLRDLLTQTRTGRLTVVACGDRTVLGSQLSAVSTQRLVLACADTADYQLAGISPRNVPRDLPPGRGLRVPDAAQLQLAQAPTGWSFDARPDPDAIRIRELPNILASQARPHQAGSACIGLGGDAVEPVLLPLHLPIRLLVAGPPRSGKTTILCNLLDQLIQAERQVAVVALPSSALHAAARQHEIQVLDPKTDPEAELRGFVLVDDAEEFGDSGVGLALEAAAKRETVSLVVASAADRLATAFRGPAAAAKRWRQGIVLQPGPLDGELLGVRLSRGELGGPVGRGVALGDPSWAWPTSAGLGGRVAIQTWQRT